MGLNGDNGEIEKELWETAEKLRGPVEAAEYARQDIDFKFRYI